MSSSSRSTARAAGERPPRALAASIARAGASVELVHTGPSASPDVRADRLPRRPSRAPRGRAGNRRSRPAGDHLLLDHRRAPVAAAGGDFARLDRGREPPRPPRRLAAAGRAPAAARRRRWCSPGARARSTRCNAATRRRWCAAARRGAPAAPRSPRDIDAITYAGDPVKRRLDLLLDAWSAGPPHGETLVVAGIDELRRRAAGHSSPDGSTRTRSARCCGEPGCSSPRRGARTTESRRSRRSPTAACSSRRRRPGPTQRSTSPASSTRAWSPTTCPARSAPRWTTRSPATLNGRPSCWRRSPRGGRPHGRRPRPATITAVMTTIPAYIPSPSDNGFHIGPLLLTSTGSCTCSRSRRRSSSPAGAGERWAATPTSPTRRRCGASRPG